MIVYQWSPFPPFKVFWTLDFLRWECLFSRRKGDGKEGKGEKKGEKIEKQEQRKETLQHESRGVADRWIAEWKGESFGNSWNERKDELDNLN